jgi:hypothetical protein
MVSIMVRFGHKSAPSRPENQCLSIGYDFA